jgi:lysozyme family protein
MSVTGEAHQDLNFNSEWTYGSSIRAGAQTTLWNAKGRATARPPSGSPNDAERMQANESLQTKWSIENMFYRLFAYLLIPDFVYRNLGARGADRE